MGESTPPEPQTAAPSIHSPQIIGFNYVWSVKVSLRALSAEDSAILHVSPKFATVHDHVSFQWSLKIHGTTGRLCSDDELLSADDGDENVPDPANYVAVELYYVDGPVNMVDVNARVSITAKGSSAGSSKMGVEERKAIQMHRGKCREMTNIDRAHMSDYIVSNLGKVVRVSVTLFIDAKMFDAFGYLDAVTPTPQESFLTANYKARVNSKVWKKRGRKRESGKIPRHEKIDYEERFRRVMEQERISNHTLTLDGRGDHRKSVISLRRNSAATIHEQLSQAPDHDHLFKKLLIACCDSCKRRRASSFNEDSRAESDEEDGEEADDEAEESFECTAQGKEHVHDLLAKMYFNKVVLPEMEYVEDFVDFLIDAELNDLPVLKRACERYLCSELNWKKDLVTWLLLDMLFISIVFSLPVMKSMTLSELSSRTEDLAHPEKLLEQEEYKNLDKRIRSLSDRNLIELIEQCQQFREQRLRVTTVSPTMQNHE